ncbi:MAG: MMPL family transporter, partial [Planctomycetota bacterium]
ERSLRRLALFAGLVGFGIAYWSFRSWKLTLAVFTVACIAAGASMAMVYWLGLIEVAVFGLPAPRLGKMDAVLNSMPAVVYVLGLSGAIHVVNYYRDERAERGVIGAVERGVRISWGPCLLAAVTTAVGMASLGASEIVPVEKFGVMTAIGVLVTFAILFTLLPVLLHLFADRHLPERAAGSHGAALPGWALAFFSWVTRRHGVVSFASVALMAALAAGLPQIKTSVELLKLLDEDVDLIHDYAWLEENLGNLVPVEVVVALDADQQRGPDEPAESPDAGRYRMTMVERLRMSQRIQERIETIDSVSRALSAASFGPKQATGGTRSRRAAADYTTSKALEKPENLA